MSSTEEQLQKIRALAFDVDGVLTDGGIFWDANGAEIKRFSFTDIMGISLARRQGILITLISGEDSPLIDRYAAKLKIVEVTKGCRDKASGLRDFAKRNGLQLDEVCFMGDDVNDLPAMKIAGFSAAPADAREVVLARVDFIAGKPGGNGAVRELVDAILKAQGADAETLFNRSL